LTEVSKILDCGNGTTGLTHTNNETKTEILAQFHLDETNDGSFGIIATVVRGR
jgi:hypothetical protein